MIETVPYSREHLLCMRVQSAQFCEHLYIPERNETEAITVMLDNSPLLCAGRVGVWEGRYQIWAVLSTDACRHMIALTREIRRWVGVCPGRLEVIVRSDFEAGHRWVKLLGFKYHHHEEMFLPDGSDADIYVRFA